MSNKISDFSRIFHLKLLNGVTLVLNIPEDIYQERCKPFIDEPSAFEAAKREIVMDAMGLERMVTWEQEQASLVLGSLEISEEIPSEIMNLLTRAYR